MASNPKNKLLELLQWYGMSTTGVFKNEQVSVHGGWRSAVHLPLPDGQVLTGRGEGQRISEADGNAAAEALAAIEIASDDQALWSEAQLGDALIKLAAYLVLREAGPEATSHWLQKHERDKALSRLFERWKDADDPRVRAYGVTRGWKFQATVVEALIWRQFNETMVSPDALKGSAELMALLEGSQLRERYD